MGQLYNVYCDESCHLENDQKKAMVLGGIFCPKMEVSLINQKMRELKVAHGMTHEIKWTKVSEQRLPFYKSIVDLFFENKFITFRAVIADKRELDHDKYKQDHNEWYYKMYFVMLEKKINTGNSYNIYLDIKDTRGARKVRKLHEVLCKNFYDFECECIKNIQNVRSHEVELIQMADLFIGMLSSNVNCDATLSSGKSHLLQYFKERCGQSMRRNTPLYCGKVNWLVWPKGEI